MLFFFLSILLQFIFSIIIFYSSYNVHFEGAGDASDAGKQKNSFDQPWGFWTSKMHEFSNGKTYAKDLGVISIKLLKKIFTFKNSFNYFVLSNLIYNILSSFLIFKISNYYFSYQTSLIIMNIYFYYFWNYMIILLGGFQIIAQFFFLLFIYLSIIATELNNLGFYFLSGISVGLIFFSSLSGRKYLLIIFYSIFHFIFLKEERLSFQVLSNTSIYLIAAIFLYLMAIYYIKKNNIFEKKIYSKINFLKTYPIYLLFFLYFIFNYTDSLEKFLNLLSVFFGIFLVFVYLLLPNFTENFKNYIRFSFMSHHQNSFERLNIKLSMLDHIKWYFNFFLKYFTVLSLLFLLNIFFNITNGNDISILLGLVVISFSTFFFSELDYGYKGGRSYYPCFVPLLLPIAYVFDKTFEISSNNYTLINYTLITILIISSIYWIFKELVTSRLDLYYLSKFIKQKKIKEIYTYNNPAHEWVLDALAKYYNLDLKVIYIDNFNQVKNNNYFLIPPLNLKYSYFKFTNIGITNTYPEKNFLNLVDNLKKKFKFYKFKTVQSSWIWQLNCEISSYNYLVKKNVTTHDFELGNINIFKIDK